MLQKGEKEKHAEMVQFAAFKQFCDDTSVEKQKAVADANEQIEVLKADIFQFASDAERLAKEIAVLDEDISVWNGDLAAAKKVREIEKTNYDAMHKDYDESIDALGRAIDVLKKKSGDKAQAESFAQIGALKDSPLIPQEAKRVITAFIQQGSSETADAP